VWGVGFRVLVSTGPEPDTRNPSLTLAARAAKVWE
jgi:hypothetical protein